MSIQDSNPAILEALILASPEPLPIAKMQEVLTEATAKEIRSLVGKLNERYESIEAAFRIREIAGGYQFYIRTEYAGYVEELFTRKRKLRMTQAALETLAIIAYRQPVTKTDIEHIRGVASDGVLQTLLERDLVAIKGRAQTVGKPLQYGTTAEFLKFFGLNTLDDLPAMSEIEQLIGLMRTAGQEELTLGESMPVETDSDEPPSDNAPESEELPVSVVAGRMTPILLERSPDEEEWEQSSGSGEGDARERLFASLRSAIEDEDDRMPEPSDAELAAIEQSITESSDLDELDDSEMVPVRHDS